MARSVANWLWKLAVLGVLVLIAAELWLLHRDITEPVDEPQSVSSTDQDDALDSIDQELAKLNQKVDAIMLAMTRARQ